MISELTIKVLIVDDHASFREGLTMLLDLDDDIAVLPPLKNGREAMQFIESGARVDVVLMDIEMPFLDGIEVTKKFKDICPEVKIVGLSMHGEQHIVKGMLNAGANGYLIKNAGREEIVTAIRKVHDNGFYCSPIFPQETMRKFFAKHSIREEDDETKKFTTRELEVIELICQQLTTQEIADRLFISNRTVDGHRARIQEKMNVKNAVGIAVFALEHGIVKH